jgi:hypothetical protein
VADPEQIDPAASPQIDPEAERRRLQEQLSREVEARYSPERLRTTVVEGAGQGEPLELGTRLEMERKIGGRFADVRIFRGPLAEAITRRHSADAVTVGGSGMILVREGPRSDPRTALGKSLLAHELTHVKQAQSGFHLALERGAAQAAPHEREAEQVEAQVHAEETAAYAKRAQPVRPHPEARRRKVIARVLELLSEQHRLLRDRLGFE